MANRPRHFQQCRFWQVLKFCYTGEAERAKNNGFDSVRLRRFLRSLVWRRSYKQKKLQGI